jgi:hypothetical protein
MRPYSSQYRCAVLAQLLVVHSNSIPVNGLEESGNYQPIDITSKRELDCNPIACYSIYNNQLCRWLQDKEGRHKSTIVTHSHQFSICNWTSLDLEIQTTQADVHTKFWLIGDHTIIFFWFGDDVQENSRDKIEQMKKTTSQFNRCRYNYNELATP